MTKRTMSMTDDVWDKHANPWSGWSRMSIPPLFGPRLLFKGGTSLSKAYSLIDRFSEDIDVTVFRDDLGHEATPEVLAALSGKQRKAAIEAIQNDCQAYITGPLLEALSLLIAENRWVRARPSGKVPKLISLVGH